MAHKKNNNRLLIILTIIAFGMLGLAYAFVPLYNAFCKLIGTPVAQIATPSSEGKTMGDIQERVVTIRFIGNSAEDVPVKLEPVVTKMRVHINQPVLTAYKAKNFSSEGIQGVAVHSLIAFGNEGEEGDVAPYVDLQQCFCFEEQYYPANEDIQLPLSFFVTEDLPKTVHTINFSYTLFEAEEE
tara:strand:- start:5118 stop:5669 length:552 start_codon:yes stop_codon:yes gene_type:complete